MKKIDSIIPELFIPVVVFGSITLTSCDCESPDKILSTNESWEDSLRKIEEKKAQEAALNMKNKMFSFQRKDICTDPIYSGAPKGIFNVNSEYRNDSLFISFYRIDWGNNFVGDVETRNDTLLLTYNDIAEIHFAMQYEAGYTFSVPVNGHSWQMASIRETGNKYETANPYFLSIAHHWK